MKELRTAGLPMPAANQIELHPWSQKPELVRHLFDSGITPIAYSSLAPLAAWRAAVGQQSAKTDQMKTPTSSASPSTTRTWRRSRGWTVATESPGPWATPRRLREPAPTLDRRLRVEGRSKHRKERACRT